MKKVLLCLVTMLVALSSFATFKEKPILYINHDSYDRLDTITIILDSLQCPKITAGDIFLKKGESIVKTYIFDNSLTVMNNDGIVRRISFVNSQDIESGEYTLNIPRYTIGYFSFNDTIINMPFTTTINISTEKNDSTYNGSYPVIGDITGTGNTNTSTDTIAQQELWDKFCKEIDLLSVKSRDCLLEAYELEENKASEEVGRIFVATFMFNDSLIYNGPMALMKKYYNENTLVEHEAEVEKSINNMKNLIDKQILSMYIAALGVDTGVAVGDITNNTVTISTKDVLDMLGLPTNEATLAIIAANANAVVRDALGNIVANALNITMDTNGQITVIFDRANVGRLVKMLRAASINGESCTIEFDANTFSVNGKSYDKVISKQIEINVADIKQFNVQEKDFLSGKKVAEVINNTTAINATPAVIAPANNKIYNISGQQISSPKHGQIYIKNGKKYIGK